MQTHDPLPRRPLYPWVGVLAGLVLVVAAAWAVEFIPGDVNDDGVFDIADPTVLRRDLAGLEPGITQMCLSELPATGQVTCVSSTGIDIPCLGTGHDGDFQAGAALAYQDNGDGTITDLNTGLIWEKLSADGSIHDRFDGYTWDDAFGVKVATLNSTAFAGHRDWRMPNVKELHSIVDYEVISPSVDPALNDGCTPACTVLTCSCTTSSNYWSSSSFSVPPFQGNAWYVSFVSGSVGNSPKPSLFSVRAVRGGSPTCGDGIVDEPSEQCDDGNSQSGDCCSSTCQFESGPCESDGEVCTDDVCDGAGTCTHPNNTAICDDGDPCTDPDQCQNGSCVPGPVCAAPLPNVASTGCISRSCEIESCFSTYHDVNQTYSDGCECQEDALDQAGFGDVCAAAYNFGVLPDDGASSFSVTGNIAPGQDSDWFTVILSDGNDALDAGIAFTSNPLRQFQMHVYQSGCPGAGIFVGNCASLLYRGTTGTDHTLVILVEVYRVSGVPASCDSYTLRVGHNSGSDGPNCSFVLP